MIRGPYVYKATRFAACASDGLTLKKGQSYYIVTGYGRGNITTVCETHVSTDLKLEATQKDVVSCQNPSCRKHVSATEFQRLGKCPECGEKRSDQVIDMKINNMLGDTRLVFRKGTLVRERR